MSDQLLELQPALIMKFMKKVLRDDQFIISSNLKAKFSRTLTIFLHYIMTIASQISKEKHRSTATVEDVKKALEETGWDEEFISALESKVLEMGARSSKSNRQVQKENNEENKEIIENNQNDINEINEEEEDVIQIDVEEEVKSDVVEEKEAPIEILE